MASSDANDGASFEFVPKKGDRIERLQPRMGVQERGTVHYADDLQILVKWDRGRSESLRPGHARLRRI